MVTIEGNKAEKAEREFLYRGISTRSFKRQYSLADHVEVKGAAFDNGLLKIELVRQIPEAMKPRRIAISGAGECGDTAIAATDFRSGGEPKGILAGLQDGWFWMETEPAAARGQTSTWAFDRLPDDSAVRVMIDVQLDRTVDPNDGDAWLGA